MPELMYNCEKYDNTFKRETGCHLGWLETGDRASESGCGWRGSPAGDSVDETILSPCDGVSAGFGYVALFPTSKCE